MNNPRAAWLLVLLSACAGPEIPEAAVSDGVAWTLAQTRKATLSDLRYGYSLEIPESVDQPVVGSLELTLNRADPEDGPLVLDFQDASGRVRSVRANGTLVEANLDHDHIAVPASALREGGNTVQVEFQAGDGSLNRNDEYLYTLFVPDRARFALPIIDQPNLKGRFTLTLTLPEEWVAVANGPEEAVETLPGGRTRARFGETRPIPSYLLAFAAGRWMVEEGMRGGRPFRVFHRETDTEKVTRNLPGVFDLHHQAIDWLEDYTGIEYPFQKFDFVLVPSFQYGGMEHPGAIFYRSDGILLDEPVTQPRRLGRASLISHETAHIWFGDLVTMDWFDDVWMKEVFANFMAAKIAHPSFPEVDHDLRFLLAHHPSAYAVDRTAGSNPIRQPLENLDEAGTLYGAIIYQKAPVVMRQLEDLMGAEAFQDGLRTYLDEHRFGNATWRDLVDVMDRRSPEDLVGWSSVWVEEAGRPTVRVTDGVVTQSDPRELGRIWPQSLTLVGERGGQPFEFTAWSDAPEVAISELATPADWTIPNGTGVEYGLFDVDAGTLAYLLDSVQDLEPDLLRGAAWVTLWDAVLEARATGDQIMPTVLRMVRQEENEQLFGTVLGALDTTFWRYLTPEQRLVWADPVESALFSRLQSRQPGSVKVAAMRTLISTVTTPDGLRWAQSLFDGEVPAPGGRLAEADRTRLAFELALREVDDWQSILANQADSIRNPDRARRYAFIRNAVDASPSVRSDFFDALRDERGREQEAWVLAGLSYLHHPLRRDTAIPFIEPSLELVEEIQRTGDIFFPGRWIQSTLDGHNSAQALEVVDTFLAARPDYPARLKLKILQARDGLERAVRISGEHDLSNGEQTQEASP